MKKQINEPDFIGGLGTLTKEEEIALSAFFSKKNKINKHEIKRVPKKKKTGQLDHA